MQVPTRFYEEPGVIDSKVFHSLTVDLVRQAREARIQAIEAAIHRFRECGVEIERFSLIDLENGITHLCIDGVPRFSVQMGYGLHGRH